MRSLIALLAAGSAAVAMAAPVAGAVPVVGCAQRAEPGGPQPSAREVREAQRTSLVTRYVTVWGVRQARGFAFDRRHRFWKAGLSVRGDRPVTIRVAARDRGWLSLYYVVGPQPRRVADGDPALRFEPCPPGTPSFSNHRPLGPETSWAGGFIVGHRGCATLLVRRAGARHATRVRIAFGARCR